MPDVDGFTLVESIRADPGLTGATIMLLTSGGGRGDAARCRELGVAAYLTKPVSEVDLRAAVMMALHGATSAAPPALITRHSLIEGRPRLRILIADDNAVNQRVLVRLLEKQGHTAVSAATGAEAVALFERERFDLILMDMHMPDLDGPDATRAIRSREGGQRRAYPDRRAHRQRDGGGSSGLSCGGDGWVPLEAGATAGPIRHDPAANRVSEPSILIHRVPPPRRPTASDFRSSRIG